MRNTPLSKSVPYKSKRAYTRLQLTAKAQKGLMKSNEGNIAAVNTSDAMFPEKMLFSHIFTTLYVVTS